MLVMHKSRGCFNHMTSIKTTIKRAVDYSENAPSLKVVQAAGKKEGEKGAGVFPSKSTPLLTATMTTHDSMIVVFFADRKVGKKLSDENDA